MIDNLFEQKDNFKAIESVGVVPVFEHADSSLLFTIAIPTYKRASDLAETVKSVLAQRGGVPFNLMVVDNDPQRGDATERYMSTVDFPRLAYYKNAENIGMAGNWNRLFQLCRTPYLVMLHDDDYLHPDFMACITRTIKAHPSISALNVKKKVWHGEQLIHIPPVKTDSTLHLVTMKPATNYYGFFFTAPSGCTFKVEDVRTQGGFNPDVYPSFDHVFIEQLILAGKQVVLARNKLLYYRVAQTTTSSQLDTQMKWLKIDEQLKWQLGEILKLPRLYQKFIVYMGLKLRLRAINKIAPGVRYKGLKGGGYLYLAFMKVWNFLYRTYYNL